MNAGSVSHYAVFAGGWVSHSYYTAVDVFDSVTRKMSTLPSLSDSVEYSAMAIVAGAILIAGGDDSSGSVPSYSSEVDIYGPCAPGQAWNRILLACQNCTGGYFSVGPGISVPGNNPCIPCSAGLFRLFLPNLMLACSF